jgi:putative membrane protein
MLGGVPGTAAAASTIVDVTMELFAQLAYTALGIAIFCAQQSRNTLPWQATLGLVFGLVGALGFVAIQRRGIGVAERAIARIAKPWVHGLAGLPRLVHAQMQAIYMRPGALWLAAALHFCAWVASSLQAWIALRFMGVDIGPASVLAIESLLYAVRSVAFAVPSAFGVQEGAYLVLGTLFGLTPEAALALSLLKRARDMVIGIPALLAWQAQEGGRLLGGGMAHRQAITGRDE